MPTVNVERQNALLEYWVNNPNKTYIEICKDCKVAKETFARWRKSEEFMERYKALCQQRFKELEAQAVEKLANAVDKGEWNAVKYVLDGQGYSATQKLDVSTNTIKVTITDD